VENRVHLNKVGYVIIFASHASCVPLRYDSQK
jgi:hypothetical protein